MASKWESPTLAPDLLARQLRLQQQADMAKGVFNQEPLQGQMVSGHYVPPNAAQAIARAIQMYGAYKTMQGMPDEMAGIQRDQNNAMMSQFGFGGQPSPQQLAAGLNGGAQSMPVDMGGGMPAQQPTQGRPMLLPGMNEQQSLMALMNLGPQKYTEMLAEGAAPSSLERNLQTAGFQPGTSEYQQFARDSIVSPYRGTTAMQNVQAMGLQPGTPEYAAAVERMTSPASTNVNINPGEKAWDTEMGKQFAQRYDDLVKQSESATQMLGLLDMAEAGFETGVRTGALGETEQSIRQLGLTLGIGDADKIAGGELVRAVQNRMALVMRSPDSGMGMPGAVSDRDLTFLKDAQVGLDRSPEGNRRMLSAFRAMEQRKLDIARLADEYIQREGRLDPGFNRAVRDYAAANPMFAPAAPEQRAKTLDDILGF